MLRISALQDGSRDRSQESLVVRISNEGFRREIAMAVGLCVYLFWAAVNLVFGIKDASTWLITLGAFYLMLALARALLLACLHKTGGLTENLAYRIESICGVLLLVSTLVLFGIVTLTMKGEGGFRYEGPMIYAMAIFVFYALISSIVGYVRLRRHESPIVVMNARINLTIALVSLFALEIAMLSAFATEQDTQLVYVMPMVTGQVMAVVLVTMGVKSIVEGISGMQSIRSQKL